MTNDAFVPRGDVVDGEIERFKTHTYADNFTIRAQHFDRLFKGDIGTGAFDDQTQIVFPQISRQRATTSSVEPLTTAVAPSSLAIGKRTATSSSSPTITILTAPIMRAIWTEKRPNGPVPKTTTS